MWLAKISGHLCRQVEVLRIMDGRSIVFVEFTVLCDFPNRTVRSSILEGNYERVLHVVDQGGSG